MTAIPLNYSQPDNQLTPKDKEQIIVAVKGARLATLIAGLPVDDAIKDGFSELIEKATTRQLEWLEIFFKNLHLQAATQEIDNNFKDQLIALKYELDKREEKADEYFLSKLESIENSINEKSKQ